MRSDKIIFLTILQFIILAILLFIEIINQSIDWIKLVIIIGLIVINAIFLFKRYHYVIRLKKLEIELQRVVSGNLNTRLLANEEYVFNNVIFSINELIEQLQKVQVQSIKSQAARKRLLSSISHDIRTPLTSIIGYVDALKDEVASSENEKREYIEIISKKSFHLKQMIDEIFHMAKLDADEIKMKLEPLDFAEIAREALIEFLPELKKHNLELKVNIQEKECFIMADRISLLRIIHNLIKNAIQYGNAGKIIGLDLIETIEEYQLFIWDKGPGIQEFEIDNVFNRMYRSDQARNSLNGGSGLGLSITKTLVEKNKGEIWVESIPWQKTTFAFSLPKQKD